MSDDNDVQIIKQDEGAALSKPTSDVSKVQSAIQLAKQRGANVLAPDTYLESGQDFEYAMKVLEFDPNRDFYRPSNSGGKAPHKNALNKIASAFGIQWHDVERVDDMKDPHFAAYKAKAAAPDPATGQMRTYVDQYALDLREGAPRTENLSDGMLESKRTHIAALAATGAKLRVIREATGVRMDYSDEQIRRPFAIVTVTKRPDEHTKQLESERASQAAKQLYGDETFDADASNDAETEASDDERAEFADEPPPDFGQPEDDQETEPDAPDDVSEWTEQSDFPDKAMVETMLMENREDRALEIVERALEVSDFDYSAALEDAGKDPTTPVKILPDTWILRVYERAVEGIDEIPF